MPTTGEQKLVYVRADHPAWNAIDDDDWNGHTLANWLQHLKGKSVLIWPPAGYGDRLGRFLVMLLNAGAERIVSGWSHPPSSGGFCRECAPLGQELESSLSDIRVSEKALRAALKRLADASEAAVSSDTDMPTHQSTMDDFDTVLLESRLLIGEGS